MSVPGYQFQRALDTKRGIELIKTLSHGQPNRADFAAFIAVIVSAQDAEAEWLRMFQEKAASLQWSAEYAPWFEVRQ